MPLHIGSLEVSSVNGATITFDTPITYPYHVSVRVCAVTDIDRYLPARGRDRKTVRVGRHGGDGSYTPYLDCAYCWVKNVESAWIGGSPY